MFPLIGGIDRILGVEILMYTTDKMFEIKLTRYEQDAIVPAYWKLQGAFQLLNLKYIVIEHRKIFVRKEILCVSYKSVMCDILLIDAFATKLSIAIVKEN